MPGRTRGRMFDIRPEDEVEDTGTGAYPGYPGYGDSDIEDFDDYAEHYAEQDTRRGVPPVNGGVPRGRPVAGAPNGGPPAPGRTGSGPVAGPRPVPPNGRPAGPRTGAGRAPVPDAAAATTAVRAVGRDTTGRPPGPGASGRLPAAPPAERDDRVAPDGRWDDEEPPLLSHRVEDDELAYARDRTPQGFDGGDPDDPSWGRRGSASATDGADDRAADEYDADEYDEYDDGEEYDDEDGYDEDEYGVGDAPLSVPPPGSGGRPLGPADVEELDPSMTDALARVDLGALQVPVPYGAELKLEPAGAERPQAVHLLLAEGRIAVSALAAPRSSGLWADLSAEIEQSLRKGGARVRNARGDWGRELHARTENAASVFVGCDGPRWMVYGVATASLETVEALDVELRRVLRGIIVVRGKSPYPPRTVLPLELPEHLREQQPEVAPQKPSITVSVPAPTGATPLSSGATTGATPVPSGPTTGARPAPVGATEEPATPAQPARPARPRRAAPAAASAPQAPAGPRVPRPAGEDAEPRTRALPQVRGSAAAAPAELPAERTELTPAVRAADPPAGRAAATGAPPAGPGADARPGRRRGRPDRPDRTGATPLGDTPATDALDGATPTGAFPATGRVAPGPDTGVPPLPGRTSIHAPAPLHAPTPADPQAGPVRAPEPAPVEPPARRDPAVTALSVADLLAGADDDRSSTPLTGAGRGTSTDDVLDARTPVPHPAPDTGTAADRPSRRDRTAGAARIDAADLLAGRARDTSADLPGATTPAAGVPAPSARPGGAIEDIPLSDVPLMEATLDRLPAPPEPAAPAPTRRRGARPVVDGADREGPADRTPDDDGWLSAEIAASRRSGRHGAGAGTSVADLLAAVALDAPAGGGRRRDDAPAAGNTAQADGPGRGSGRRTAPAAAPPDPGGDDLFRAPAAEDRPWHGGGPTSADEARSALQDLLRSASADRGDTGGPGADRADGHGADGHGGGVTGLADYRASRAAAARAAGNTGSTGHHGDATPAPTGGDPGTDPGDDDAEALGGLDGRAAGGSGLTGRWSSGRRAGGTGPRDLGRHRRD
ncbi:DUF3710 domain-containing protein [Pseudonocardia sp. ICBG1293]|uniref:DUF3710 domain-containing protein n=1 Tax=Pseudonocardia sp. ICBG1293 TaxID=2844382 RepID=UPI001CCE1D5D|nr:DUF3710 domain-containing protein [Pseudonocardia sp. ICBG1293]